MAERKGGWAVTRCLTCPNLFRCVPGDGPEPILSSPRVLFIGSMPGKEEDSTRSPRPMYSGKSGLEFNETYLRLAGLDRDLIRITNARKCRTESGKAPKDEEIFACAAHHLPDEIAQSDPEFIVLMGAAACSLVPEINLEVEHGIPTTATLFGWTGPVIPMFHPSSGMHDSSAMIPLLEDFTRLREILAGTWTAPTNNVVAVYQYVRTSQQVVDSFPVPPFPCAFDMETHDSVPFSVQWSTAPGRAYMMLISDLEIDQATRRLRGFTGDMRNNLNVCIEHFTFECVLHNAPGDLDVLDAIGLKTSAWTIRDTMQEAYHFGNLPQGLKALAYRLLGVRMKSWKEVVGPPSRTAVLNWLESAISWSTPELEIVEFQQLKTKVKKVVKLHPLTTRLKAIYRYSCYNDDYPTWEHLDKLKLLEPTSYSSVESTCGPTPRLGIANCTPSDALEYACKDADMTRRVALVLAKLRQNFTPVVNKADYDEV